MKTRTIGSLNVSEVGVGCNNFGGRLDQERTNVVVHSALENGINFFDTADVYGDWQSEVLLGRALAGRRDDAVIATKFGITRDGAFSGAPDYIRSAVEASLTRLGTDHIDLLQYHFPDGVTPIAETIGAMQELVAAGKVREIGCSNFSEEQLREAHVAAGSGPRFVSVQSQYSLLYRAPETDGVLATCRELNIAFLPYYPLANGLLTGKVRPGEPLPEGTRLSLMPPERAAHWTGDAIMEQVGRLLEVSEAFQTPLLSAAFSWLLSHPEVASVIAGASNDGQIAANAAAAIELSAAHIAALSAATA
jgi:aryl-alcohol dehydrogenase-like predicted oxidoreductase